MNNKNSGEASRDLQLERIQEIAEYIRRTEEGRKSLEEVVNSLER